MNVSFQLMLFTSQTHDVLRYVFLFLYFIHFNRFVKLEKQNWRYHPKKRKPEEKNYRLWRSISLYFGIMQQQERDFAEKVKVLIYLFRFIFIVVSTLFISFFNLSNTHFKKDLLSFSCMSLMCSQLFGITAKLIPNISKSFARVLYHGLCVCVYIYQRNN